MNVIEKLKKHNVEITPEMEKDFAGEWISTQEAEKKQKKFEDLETDKKALQAKVDDLEKELSDIKESSKDYDSMKAKVEELTNTLNQERQDRAAKDETERLNAQVAEFFTDKHFVNEITENSIKSTLVAELQKDTAKGRSISDIFDSIVKNEKGEIKPGIMINNKTWEAAKNRSSLMAGSSITGNDKPLNVTKEQFFKMSFAERSRLKEESPELYEQLKKGV